jgi:hypothetical protein
MRKNAILKAYDELINIGGLAKVKVIHVKNIERWLILSGHTLS